MPFLVRHTAIEPQINIVQREVLRDTSSLGMAKIYGMATGPWWLGGLWPFRLSRPSRCQGPARGHRGA